MAADESAIGKEIVCPIGMIAAVALMLRYRFGLEAEAVFVVILNYFEYLV